MKKIAFRIRQNGQTVARTEGNDTEAEAGIMHYARQYREDGELTIQHNAEGHWKRYALLCQWPTPHPGAHTMSGFDCINRTYGLNLKRESRVEYTGGKTALLGTVMRAQGAHIIIRFDGETAWVGPFHPTWEMRVLPTHTQEPTNE